MSAVSWVLVGLAVLMLAELIVGVAVRGGYWSRDIPNDTKVSPVQRMHSETNEL